MLRTGLYADPHGRFVHDVILESCSRVPHKTAIIDSSCDDSSCGRRITYSEYGELIENIALGLESASDQEVREAAESANIAADIEGFPEGYQTMVGERGITLSGGQKQRTAIARVQGQ